MDSDEVRRQWAEQSGAYSPGYYAYYGPDEASEWVRDALEQYVDRDAAVLEVGCSSGRHLAHLREHGFENLTGVEVNADAFEVMAETYPDLAAGGTFYQDGIEDVVTDFADGQFDAVYTVETLQHLHPDLEWVFAELARVTGSVLVTVENESASDGEAGDGRDPADGSEERSGETRDGDETRRGGETRDGDETGSRASDPEVTVVDGVPLYHRDWRRVFTDLGLVEVEAHAGDRDTVRAFRPAGGDAGR